MKLLAPVLGSYTITQKFGGNANPLYASQGLFGHPAVDLVKAYDAYIVSSYASYVYKIVNKDNPDLSRYRAVHTLFQDEGQWYELVYGHCNKIYARVGDTVPVGSLLASMGNTGDVYYQGLPVPVSQRDKAPYPGTHLHWQLRRVVLSPTASVGKRYLDTETPTGERQDALYQDRDGNYYEVPEYDNGYNGCIDAEPYLYKPTFWEQLQIAKNILLYEQGKLKAA
jgi:murein DD-endopeptidase MepM/ murein hydrolase activator NlpD